MQEPETTQKPRVQYSLLDLMAVVLLFGAHMALMTKHYLAGVDYALGYTCFALGLTLVLFIFSQRKIEAARAHRPVAFLACAFLVFGTFHAQWPSTTNYSAAIDVLSQYKISPLLPAGSTTLGSSTSSGNGLYASEHEVLQEFSCREPVRNVVLDHVVGDLLEKLRENGASLSKIGHSQGGTGNNWRDSQTYEFYSQGWRGILKIACGSRVSEGKEPEYWVQIDANEIRR